MDEKCTKCKITKYGYTDGQHSIFLCFKCGRYEGINDGDKSFINQINEEPMLLLMMIKDKILIPIS
jgi:Fe2+ or Zn2+ uptake regulation protein